MEQKHLALSAIRKKLIGQSLNYNEIYAIMDEISHQRLGDVLTTYFAASGYSKGFTDEELYFLTKAMVATGETLKFKGIVADKHSIGGVPGTRTTPIVVPIVASAGFKIPKSSSRAITTPDGTADDMEVIAPVTLTKEQIYKVVEKTNGCIVWGGSFHIAPADDILIQVEKPLMFESFDKIIVSILAKKIAFGATHVVIDLPYGPTVKVHSLHDAEIFKDKFIKLAKKFGMKMIVLTHKTDEPAGRGIGPVLEMREVLRVLEQKEDRPMDLEERSIKIAGNILEMCLDDSPKEKAKKIKKEFGDSFEWARSILRSGNALHKLQEIVEAQGGNPDISSEKLNPGGHVFEMKAVRDTEVLSVNNKNATIIAKVLGAPKHKKAGIYLNKKNGEEAKKGDTLCTLYSENVYNLKEGKQSLTNFPIFELE